MSTAIREYIFQCLELKPGNQLPFGLPASLSRNDISIIQALVEPYMPYVCSPKADGKRVYLGHRKSTQGFIIDRAETITSCHWFNTQGDTLFDCEIDEKMIWIFDAIMVNGHSVHKLAYHMRLAAAQSFLSTFLNKPLPIKPECSVLHVSQTITMMHDYNIIIKPIWAIHNMKYAVKWAESMKLPCDGMIFTPLQHPVPIFRSPKVFKWKDPSAHTVDFFIRDGRLYVTDEKSNLVLYAGTVDRTIENNCVHECKINEHTKWIAIKLRKDKLLPNSRFVVDRTCSNVQENLKLLECYPN